MIVRSDSPDLHEDTGIRFFGFLARDSHLIDEVRPVKQIYFVNRMLVLALAVFLTGLLPGLVRAQGTWKAGVSRIKITPESYMWMSGYGGRMQPADGKNADLWAKVLLLEDSQGSRGYLVSLDLIGMDRTLSEKVCGLLKEKCGVERSRVMLCFSHTHTGPVVGRNLEPLHYRQVDGEQQTLIDQYALKLETYLIDCVGGAIEDLEPCKLAWGSGTADFAVNRRNNPERDVVQLRAADALKGPVDHDVPVLSVRDAEGGVKAIVFGYACHATVMSNTKWSGDYPGFAQSELEDAYPGSVAMFWAGCGADQNPLPRRKLELAQKYGRQLATAVGDVLAKPMAEVSGSLVPRYREVSLELDKLPTRDELTKDAESKDRFVRARAEMLLEQIASGHPLSQTYPYPIGAWQLGDQVQFVFLGGEVVVDLSIRLKRELNGTGTWVAGYCNDVMAYIPSLRVLREGRYEGVGAMVYYGLPTAWGPQVETTVCDGVHSIFDGGE